MSHRDDKRKAASGSSGPADVFFPEGQEEAQVVSAEEQAAEAERIPAGNRFRILVAVLLALVLIAGGFYTGWRVQKARMDEELTAARNRITELEIQTGERNADGSPRTEEDNTAILAGTADLDPETKDMMGDVMQSDANTILIGEDSLTDESVIVAEFKGGNVNAAEAMAQYDDLVFGLSLEGEDAHQNADLFRRAIDMLIAEKVAYARAKELGLTEYTEADEAEIKRLAKEFDLSETEVRVDYWRIRLRNEIGKDVEITEEAARKEYDMRAADEKEYFEKNPGEYAKALENGQGILYDAERAVAIRYRVIPFSDEDKKTAAELLTKGDEESLAAYDALCAKYTEGVDMNEASLNGAKNAVVTETTDKVDIIQGSDVIDMKKGDHLILRGDTGVALVACDETYAPGKREPSAAAIATIREDMREIALEQLYNETVDGWVEQAKPVYHDEDLY